MSGGGYGLGPKDPRQIGPYRVDGLLGQGGMGRVYLGRDPVGRPVAIKMIKDDLATNAEYLRRFREEAANARRIARQHTAQVLDFNIDGGSPYLVTEYVKGQTLRDRIRHGQPIVGSELDQLAFVLATALQAMHQVGLIHRDLKPENVILSSMGPRVIDFGVARVADSPHEPDRISTFVGTLGYIAPEILDSRPATAKVDIFAWGATVAFAGTGRPTFGDGGYEQRRHRTLGQAPDLRGLEAPLRDVVERALHKSPTMRPSAADLVRVLNGGAVLGAGLDEPSAGHSGEPPARTERELILEQEILRRMGM
ncbi:serine/threonine protein kinase [Frankia sp. AgPm24]|uniref:serine/threonine-protein kinase n=1 Tax=Frankia sp. AgPm24 TaxID=631128 RepID=UPI00200BDB1D|nr:serine/threonine-protein kinase [Frankia sp. AgPm24]MCK9925316.1 serine/threonine protein kinase [Frankia sp. AgPm24]